MSRRVSLFGACEGDFLELQDDSIFEVKGLTHPPGRVIAYPRYVIDDNGDRVRDSKRFKKLYSFKERNYLMNQKYSSYLVIDPVFNRQLPEVPYEEVRFHNKPEDALYRLRHKDDIDETERRAVELADLLENISGVSSSNIGISGSIMVGFHKPSSDIDIVTYGAKESMCLRDSMKNTFKNQSNIRRYSHTELVNLYRFRVPDTIMPFDEFVKHEKRKSFQGIFKDHEFFIRYLSESKETYGDSIYFQEGLSKIKAKVTDCSESFFTPCKYQLGQVEVTKGIDLPGISEAVSYRGRFCEQAEVGEEVELQGALEKVVSSTGEHRRIILGERPSDFMVSLNLD